MEGREQLRPIYEAALELLQDGTRWTRGALARTESGFPIFPRYEGASKWCLVGAVLKCGGAGKRSWDVLDDVSGRLFNGMPCSVANDQHGHSAALAILRAAIKEVS